jgi:hypothetical protein
LNLLQKGVLHIIDSNFGLGGEVKRRNRSQHRHIQFKVNLIFEAKFQLQGGKLVEREIQIQFLVKGTERLARDRVWSRQLIEHFHRFLVIILVKYIFFHLFQCSVVHDVLLEEFRRLLQDKGGLLILVDRWFSTGGFI